MSNEPYKLAVSTLLWNVESGETCVGAIIGTLSFIHRCMSPFKSKNPIFDSRLFFNFYSPLHEKNNVKWHENSWEKKMTIDSTMRERERKKRFSFVNLWNVGIASKRPDSWLCDRVSIWIGCTAKCRIWTFLHWTSSIRHFYCGIFSDSGPKIHVRFTQRQFFLKKTQSFSVHKANEKFWGRKFMRTQNYHIHSYGWCLCVFVKIR